MNLRDISGHGPPASPDTADVTLVLVHHAGGSAASFLQFTPHLPAQQRVLAPELPMRLTSPNQPPCTDFGEATARLVQALRRAAPGPYALFGHCLGAILAFEVARALEQTSQDAIWVGVSGSPPPREASVPRGRGEDDPWPVPHLTAYLDEVGGVPPSVWQNPPLTRRMLRTLRSDLLLADSYGYIESGLLQAPISTYCGQDDSQVRPAQIREWAGYTAAGAAHHVLPGGHFYLFDQPEAMCSRILGDIRTRVVR